MTGAILALILGAADPCAPVLPAAVPAPAEAAAYRAAGDEERAAGDREGASFAYRAAAALDPADAASRERLRALCLAPAPRADPFEAGLRRMEAHDWRAAAESFGEARRATGDRSAALLEGICRYNLGEEAEAAPLLRAAEAQPEHRDLARFYLGLVALREGAAPRAAELFAQAAASPELASLASDLSRLARQDSGLVLTLLGETGFDSNVTQAPRNAAAIPGVAGTTSGDGLYGFAGSALYRPLGRDGPFLRASGFARQQLQLGSYDFAGLEAGAGWQATRDGAGAQGGYDFLYRTFGGRPFLAAHRFSAGAWLTAGLTWSARYALQLENYQSSNISGFSGTVHSAELRAALPFGPGGWLAAVYGLTRDAAKLGIASYTEQGPRLELRSVLGPRLRLGASAGLSFRSYDDLDPVLGVRRKDRYLTATLTGEYDLAPGWTARASLQGFRALSSSPAFEYDKLVPTVGVVWQKGL